MTDTILAPIEADQTTTITLPAIPCEYVNPDHTPCENEAEWILYLVPHDCNTEGETSHRLMCDPCVVRIKSGDIWTCHKCGRHSTIIKYITRIERI